MSRSVKLRSHRSVCRAVMFNHVGGDVGLTDIDNADGEHNDEGVAQRPRRDVCSWKTKSLRGSGRVRSIRRSRYSTLHLPTKRLDTRAYRSGNVALGPEPVCHSAGLRRDGTTKTRGLQPSRARSSCAEAHEVAVGGQPMTGLSPERESCGVFPEGRRRCQPGLA
jgi:hypothetical protein